MRAVLFANATVTTLKCRRPKRPEIQGRSRRDRGRRPARILTIEPLIDIVREIDHTLAYGERAATILVRARSNTESVGVIGYHAFRLPCPRRRSRRRFVPAFAVGSRSNKSRRHRARPARDGSISGNR